MYKDTALIQDSILLSIAPPAATGWTEIRLNCDTAVCKPGCPCCTKHARGFALKRIHGLQQRRNRSFLGSRSWVRSPAATYWYSVRGWGKCACGGDAVGSGVAAAAAPAAPAAPAGTPGIVSGVGQVRRNSHLLRTGRTVARGAGQLPHSNSSSSNNSHLRPTGCTAAQ